MYGGYLKMASYSEKRTDKRFSDRNPSSGRSKESTELPGPQSRSDLSLIVRPLSTRSGKSTPSKPLMSATSRPSTTAKQSTSSRNRVPQLEMPGIQSQATISSISSRSNPSARLHSWHAPRGAGGERSLTRSRPKLKTGAVVSSSTPSARGGDQVGELERPVSAVQYDGGGNMRNTTPGHHQNVNKLVVVDSDEFQAKLVSAATKIQRWYRNAKHRKYQTQLLRVLLADKRSKLTQSMERGDSGLVRLSQERKDIEEKRKKHKEQKANDNRQAAIVSLQKVREEKRLLAQLAAEEEYKYLETSGKVKPKSSHKSALTKKHVPAKGYHAPHDDTREGEEMTSKGPLGEGMTSKGPLVSSVDTDTSNEVHNTPNSVDAIFEANSSYRQPPVNAEAIKTDPSAVRDCVRQTKMADILEALKILEEEPIPLDPGKSSSDPPTSTSGSTPWTLETADDDLGNHSSERPLRDSKLSNILAYLDEVDAATSDTISRTEVKTEGLQSPSSNTITSSASSEPFSKLDAASVVTMDVTSTIQSLRMEVDDKNRTIEMLQKALSQQRELTVYHAKEQEKEGNRRLDIQRQEYEATIKRHLSFIDQLIDDKKGLSERCEKLISQMKELERRYTMKVKTMEERHSIELERQREHLMNAEKQRRDKWMQEQSRKIKEVTVKGLEPEIQRIIAKHKAELAKVKALHEAELLQADERASRKFVQQTQELREQLQKEKESDCAREREMAKNQYEKAASQEEAAYQQQRRRLYAEVEEEKERMAMLAQQQRADLDRRMKEMMESHSKSITECKSEYERTLSEQERRHASELRDLKERLEIEKEAWEENYMKKQGAILLSKERELKDKLRQDRDKEIELVISKLEEETRCAREECELAAENRIKRIREKYENELREVEKSEKSTQEKYSSLKEKVVSLEGELVDLKLLMKKKDNEIEQISEVSSKLTKERDSVTDVVRQEFADRVVATEEENKSLKIDMSELKARHKVELEQAQKKMEKEMEQVHERVKQAILKKEEAMKSLRGQHEAALKRAEHLEMLLERQRQELLKK